MKKLVVAVMFMFLLAGCSSGEVNKSIDYVNEATDHINHLTNFAEDAPQRIQEASSEPAVKKELKSDLNSLKDEINAFNKIDAPSIAEDVHEKLVSKNEEILANINRVLDDDQLTLDKLEDSQLVETIRNTTDLLNRIENLGI